jgi:hypothetical protein
MNYNKMVHPDVQTLLRWLQMAWGVNNTQSALHGALGRTYSFWFYVIT